MELQPGGIDAGPRPVRARCARPRRKHGTPSRKTKKKGALSRRMRLFHEILLDPQETRRAQSFERITPRIGEFHAAEAARRRIRPENPFRYSPLPQPGLLPAATISVEVAPPFETETLPFLGPATSATDIPPPETRGHRSKRVASSQA